MQKSKMTLTKIYSSPNKLNLDFINYSSINPSLLNFVVYI